MAYIGAFHNYKGGTGKTTITGNIGALLASRVGSQSNFSDASILLIDADAQCNLTKWLIGPDYKKLNVDISHVLNGMAQPMDAILEVRPHLYLLPCKSSNLNNYSETILNNEPLVFKDLVKSYVAAGFDYILFDMSPSLRRLEKCIILALQEVMITMEAEYFSYDGLTNYKDEVNNLVKMDSTFNPDILKRLVVNKTNHTFSRHKIYLLELAKIGMEIFEVAQNSHIATSQTINKFYEEYLVENFPYEKDQKALSQLNTLVSALIGG